MPQMPIVPGLERAILLHKGPSCPITIAARYCASGWKAARTLLTQGETLNENWTDNSDGGRRARRHLWPCAGAGAKPDRQGVFRGRRRDGRRRDQRQEG